MRINVRHDRTIQEIGREEARESIIASIKESIIDKHAIKSVILTVHNGRHANFNNSPRRHLNNSGKVF